MLIALDVRSLLQPLTGVGNYTFNLLWHILEQDEHNDYLLLGPPGIRRNLIEARLSREEKVLRLKQTAIGRVRRRSAQQRLKMFMRYGSIVFFRLNYSLRRANLFFGPNFFGFFSSSHLTVITVHDLSYLIHPDCIAKKTLRFLQKYMPKCLARADRIIAVSKNTKKDLVRLCGVPEEKISVVYPGYNSEVFRPAKIEHRILSDTFNLEPGYILYVGTIEPRKNLVTLLEAYRLLGQRGITAPLVLCGPMGWKSEPFLTNLKSLRSTNTVRLLGYVDEQWLPLLYSGASCFVFPSLYEGFGFPVLEAMACGCPVVSSGVSAIPEVVGGAGLLLDDPRDENLLAEAVSRILEDQDLRAELRAEGIKQASHFSWRKTARETLKIFTDLLERER